MKSWRDTGIFRVLGLGQLIEAEDTAPTSDQNSSHGEGTTQASDAAVVGIRFYEMPINETESRKGSVEGEFERTDW